ncbi:MAG TPA: hypothetical protein VJQ52_13340 [Steroidobacteraceae bacterium]|nr:hypothetical protein [Steroidobacteraceae bacterium]
MVVLPVAVLRAVAVLLVVVRQVVLREAVERQAAAVLPAACRTPAQAVAAVLPGVRAAIRLQVVPAAARPVQAHRAAAAVG